MLSQINLALVFPLTDTLRVDFNKVAHPKWPNGTKVGSSVVHTKGTLAAKKNFLRRLFWREIQIQKLAILYEGEFEWLISAGQELPPPILLLPKIPSKRVI